DQRTKKHAEWEVQLRILPEVSKHTEICPDVAERNADAYSGEKAFEYHAALVTWPDFVAGLYHSPPLSWPRTSFAVAGSSKNESRCPLSTWSSRPVLRPVRTSRTRWDCPMP